MKIKKRMMMDATVMKALDDYSVYICLAVLNSILHGVELNQFDVYDVTLTNEDCDGFPVEFDLNTSSVVIAGCTHVVGHCTVMSLREWGFVDGIYHIKFEKV